MEPYPQQLLINSTNLETFKRSSIEASQLIAAKINVFNTILSVSEEALKNRNANANLFRLVKAYRTHGHRQAAVDPLGLSILP